MIADQEKKRPAEDEAQDQVDGNAIARLYPRNRETSPPLSKVRPHLPSHQGQQPQPRDRANTIDGPLLRSLITMGTTDSPQRSSSSTSSSSVAASSSQQPSQPPSSTPSPSASLIQTNPQPEAPKAVGLLYSLLVSNDEESSPSTSRRLKQPSPTPSASGSEAKKHRYEEPARQGPVFQMPAFAPVGHRRFSFGGYSSARHERVAALQRGPATMPVGFRPSGFDRRMERPIPEAPASGCRFKSSAYSMSSPSILSTLISSPSSPGTSPGPSLASTDSGVDEPLDLTGRARRRPTNVIMQLAKKTARPLQSRITELMKQAGKFMFTKKARSTDWTCAFRASWHKLLVLSMAQHSLDVVAVNSPHTAEHVCAGEPILPWLLPPTVPQMIAPTQDSVNQILQCLTDLRMQRLSDDEFNMLRHAVLISGKLTI